MQKELSEFIASERNRFEVKHNNMFAFSFREVERYYDFIEIIYVRHASAVKEYLKAFNALQRTIDKSPGSHSTTAEQLVLLETLLRLGNIVQLEIESYYLFAKMLLDKIARAVEFYFGKAHKLALDSHDDFVKCIEAYSAAKNIALDERLVTLAKKLKNDISDFRDHQIAHLKSPRTVRGTTGDGRMSFSQIYPTEKDEQKETQLLDSLSSEIGEYTELVIAFIKDNKEKTALRLNTTA